MNIFGTLISDWLVFILIITICATSIWAFYFWWKKDRYTRERFAFMGFLTLAGFGSLYLISFTTDNSLIGSLVNKILSKSLGLSHQPISSN